MINTNTIRTKVHLIGVISLIGFISYFIVHEINLHNTSTSLDKIKTEDLTQLNAINLLRNEYNEYLRDNSIIKEQYRH